ncbi:TRANSMEMBRANE PROTEIN 18 [Salix koriyanagi]|uniref:TRANSMEMBRANE PROTEIN 18 n=1 Tax=Salix koriyanagi TaxID=2511006 RepID=A0A9Q0VZZ5_9ROSI|nr:TRANSMEMBRANE PROTEIN 18 [Salix koriyanagi]
MIGESNAEFFSTRTSLSTARVEAQSASEMLGTTENGSLLRKGHEPINYFSLGIEMVSLCLPVKDLSENDSKKVRKENQNLELDALESSCKVGSQENFTANLLVNLNSACSDDHAVALDPTYEEGTRENFTENLLANLNSSCSDDHDPTDVLEVESHDLSRDDRGQSEYTSICSALLAEESVSSSSPVGFLSDIIDGKKCQTPESVLASIENQENLQSSHVGPEKKLSSHNIWSRREAAEEILTPGKENYSPNTLLLKSLKKKGKREETQLSNSRRSTLITGVHVQSNFAGDGRRRWTMVADTASLVDKESRKSLQLLQGLKGTHLVIPKMVIRELDCLKRRSSLFRRKTEASMLLEWIEECMVRTPWWIHVQSSVEEGRHIAPTPPASPPSRFSQGSEGFPCGSGSSVPFPAHGSLLEIVSPTAEDHILEYALSYRKMNRDGQLILLSNDVTLKIKAMAEGLICETAKEFRDSLVNPFSERFLWADSSPRGLTWSVSDDLVLKDRYYRSPSKKSSKGEGAKGLKLILLHNSQYGQISQSVRTS